MNIVLETRWSDSTCVLLQIFYRTSFQCFVLHNCISRACQLQKKIMIKVAHFQLNLQKKIARYGNKLRKLTKIAAVCGARPKLRTCGKTWKSLKNCGPQHRDFLQGLNVLSIRTCMHYNVVISYRQRHEMLIFPTAVQKPSSFCSEVIVARTRPSCSSSTYRMIVTVSNSFQPQPE